MADDADKQFDPTARRLEKAREDGNVAQSQEVLSAGMLALAATVLFLGLPRAFHALEMTTRRLFLRATETNLTLQSVPDVLAGIGWQLAWVLGPFLLMMMAGGIALNVLQTGWNVTLKPLEPKLSSISPKQGFQRIFSSKGAFELLKTLIKIAVVGPVVYFTVTSHLDQILLLHTHPLVSSLSAAGGWIGILLAQMIGALVFLAVLDFSFQKWKHKEDLKMSKQEIEDEQKEQEGDPEMKGRRLEMAQEIRDKPRMDHAVMKSDVVVTNPTHYAIALVYEADSHAAPRVLVKGVRKRALRIKELARENDVPTVEDRPLAHALYDNVPEEAEIPEELYPAVATILAEVYRENTSYGQ